MTIEQLKKHLADGSFHHATYRDHGTIWEGLWIYIKSDDRIGYKPYGSFPKGVAADEAHEIVKHTGVSVGAYGRG